MTKVMQRIGVLVAVGQIVLGCERSDSSRGTSEQLVCPAYEVDCGDGCVSLFANSSHCGSCDNHCPSGQICVDMRCACPGGGTLCDSVCVVTAHDDDNCGRCGNRCPTGHDCMNGICWELSFDGSGGWATGGESTAGGTGGAAGTTGLEGAAGGETSSAGGSGGRGPNETGGAGGSSETRSSGCSASDPPGSGRYSIDVSGTRREYVVQLPFDYVRGRQYPLVVAWHWLGGTAAEVAAGFSGSLVGPFYGLEEQAEDGAIFVAPEGIDQGWANPGGRDVEFARELIARLDAELCIDARRIFSTGFSHGGMMSNAVGCAVADVFRAIAPMSGSLGVGCEPGTAPIAVWSAHGLADTDVPIDAGREARDEFLDRNGCADASSATDPSPCVSYDDCAADQPVVWCEWDGGHAPPEFAPQAIWDFFMALR